MFGDHLECISVGKVKGGLVHKRTANHVFIRTRCDRVESQRGEEQPRRHLSKIVVPDKTIGSGSILRLHNLPQPFLRSGRRVRVDIEIGKVMARFVTVDILPNHAANVLNIGVLMRVDLGIEHRVKLRNQLRIAAKQIDQSLFILRLKPGILPGIAFREAAARSGLGRVERRRGTLHWQAAAQQSHLSR